MVFYLISWIESFCSLQINQHEVTKHLYQHEVTKHLNPIYQHELTKQHHLLV